MPLRGRTRKVGRWIVIVIGAAATITPMVVWHVASNDVGNYIEAACQFLVVIAVLAHILRWKAVTRWLDRVGLGRDDPPTDLPASPNTPTKGTRNDAQRPSRNPRTRPTSRPTRRTRSRIQPGCTRPRLQPRRARSGIQSRPPRPRVQPRLARPRVQPGPPGPGTPTDLGWLA